MDPLLKPRFLSRRSVVAGAASGVTMGCAAERPSRRPAMSFDRERFVDDCVAASAEHDPQAAVREVLARAVADHSAVLSALGAPDAAGLDVLHRSPTLTIFAAKWAPRMHLPAHDHRMWALIGIYTGRE